LRLRFRRGSSGYARLAHFYRAFGVAFLWGCYHQILGPLLDLPKFANGLCRYSDASVHVDSHLIWQATESYVERSSAFGLISHKGSGKFKRIDQELQRMRLAASSLSSTPRSSCETPQTLRSHLVASATSASRRSCRRSHHSLGWSSWRSPWREYTSICDFTADTPRVPCRI
jgi:hypothetical protein